MRYHAFVLHNISHDMFWGFRPETSRLEHAHTFVIVADNPGLATEVIWVLTNVDSADHLRLDYPHLAQYAEDVTLYRARRNRSLSVGDVVMLHAGEAFVTAQSCEKVGWKPYTEAELNLNVKGLEFSNEAPVSQAYRAMQKHLQQPARLPDVQD